MDEVTENKGDTLVELLKTRRFLPLFLTQFLGAFNDNVLKNSLIFLFTYAIAYQTSLPPSIMTPLAAGLFTLPFLLFSAHAGHLADRWEKSGLVKRIKLLEIFIMAMAAFGFYLQEAWLMLFILFLMGVQSTYFGPLKYALLPEHLKTNELIAGNAIIETGTFLAILSGSLCGGLFILSPLGSQIIASVLLAVAVVGFISSLSIPKTPVREKGKTLSLNIFLETWDMVNLVRSQPVVFRSILANSWFWFVGASYLTLLPDLGRNVLMANETVVNGIMVVFSVSIGIGSILCEKLLKGEITARLTVIALWGMSFGAAVLTVSVYMFEPLDLMCMDAAGHSTIECFANFAILGANSISFWFVLLGFALVSVFGGMYVVPLYAIMQNKSKENMRGKVIGVNNIINSLYILAASALLILVNLLGGNTSVALMVILFCNIAFTFIFPKLELQE